MTEENVTEDNGVRDTADRLENNEVYDVETNPVIPVSRPQPVPRRSTRERRPPQKYSDFYMNQMVFRPRDNKIYALNTLLQSGILDNIDSDTVHVILGAIINT
ncbi:hypothetical protein ACF0H5_007131 [Mactra antiquata]